MKKFEYIHPGDSTQILDAALETLGLDRNFLFQLLDISEKNQKNWDAGTLGSTTWYLLCKYLRICPESSIYGYCEEDHKRRICGSIRIGERLPFPKTQKIKELVQHAKRVQKEEIRDRRNHLSFRLRMKQRVSEIKESLWRNGNRSFPI